MNDYQQQREKDYGVNQIYSKEIDLKDKMSMNEKRVFSNRKVAGPRTKVLQDSEIKNGFGHSEPFFGARNKIDPEALTSQRHLSNSAYKNLHFLFTSYAKQSGISSLGRHPTFQGIKNDSQLLSFKEFNKMVLDMGLNLLFERRMMSNNFMKECAAGPTYKGQINFASFQRLLLTNMMQSLGPAKPSLPVSTTAPTPTFKNRSAEETEREAWSALAHHLKLNEGAELRRVILAS